MWVFGLLDDCLPRAKKECVDSSAAVTSHQFGLCSPLLIFIATAYTNLKDRMGMNYVLI